MWGLLPSGPLSERTQLEACSQRTISQLKTSLETLNSQYAADLRVNPGMRKKGVIALDGVLGFEAPKESALSWASMSYFDAKDCYAYSLRAWNSARINVPHLFAEIGASKDVVWLRVEHLARADAKTSAGERWWRDAEELWFTPEAVAATEKVRSLTDARPLSARLPELNPSPLGVAIELPRTPQHAEMLVGAYEQALARWLRWRTRALAPGRATPTLSDVRALHTYDSRLRAFAFAEEVRQLEDHLERPVMPRALDVSRRMHPSRWPADVRGGRYIGELGELGIGGRVILAEAGPHDPFERWVPEGVRVDDDVPTLEEFQA